MFGKNKKTLKQLRKAKSLTAKQLAERAGIHTSLVQRVDNHKIKTIPEPLKSTLLEVLKD